MFEQRRRVLKSTLAVTAAAGLAPYARFASAQPVAGPKKYDPGATDTEIKMGHIVPYSGPVSAYGTIGRASLAFFEMINANGGINGRKVNLLSVDDAYTPSRTVEQTRKLVEQDEVLLMFAPLGTAQNMAIQKYLNAKKVPQLFVNTGASRFADPKNFPWTMGWQPSYQAEGHIFAQHILVNNPKAKIAVLYQNDDFGKDVRAGLMEGLGDKAKAMVVAESTYETSDPTIDSQMVALRASGADTFVNITTPKFAAQSVRKAGQLGWKPQQYLARVSISVSAVMKPAGPENGTGVISLAYVRDPADPSWHASKEYEEYSGWMKKYYPSGDITDSLNVLAYACAQTMVQVLKQCGNTLTRENVMKQAANLDMTLPLLSPGVTLKTSPTDFSPVKGMQPVRFNGSIYEPFGPVLTGAM
ncbi:MAG: branched-chain amino acid transporter substrate-binding protein [Rhizobacter sp.]|nr:branched-chain amino acid transporter substrate-binding protein [Rhizobacter sp.]